MEFDSTRKRMSVVVRYPCGRVFIVTKVRRMSRRMILSMCTAVGMNMKMSIHMKKGYA